MSAADKSFAEVFQVGGRKKRNSTQKLRSSHARAKAQRVAGGSAEVMVKITGYGKGIGHPAAHIKYISRNGKLELENERGDVLTKEDIKDLASAWSADFADVKRHKNQRDTMHLFFSMPPGTPPEDVRESVRDFLKDRFSHNHEYVFALHTDQPHPHVHTSIKMVGFNGKRLEVDRDDLQEFREGFALNLRKRGIDAEATPREVRGVVKKAENLIVHHIAAGDKSHPPRVPKVKAGLVREAVEELVSENSNIPIPAKPWEAKILDRQNKVREAWRNVATSLRDDVSTFNFRNNNERPDYDRPRQQFAGIQRRVAGLYKPDFTQAGKGAAPGPNSSVRDLPSVHVVHKSVIPSLLVHENASISMGGNSGPNHHMRRSGFGVNAASERARGPSAKGTRQSVIPLADAELAAKITGFLEKMPAPKTLLQETKERLRVEYTTKPTATQANAPAKSKVAELKPTQEKQIQQQRKPDLEL